MVDIAPESPVAEDDPTGERALAELAERYRLLVDLSPDAIGVHEGGIIVYANPAAVRYARAESAAELVGRPITDVVHPSSIPDMLTRLMGLTEEGMVTEPAEALMQPVRGEVIETEIVSVRTVWAGRPAFQVIMRDISIRRAAESALRYRAALVEHVTDAIIATTADGIVQAWNPAAEQIYGRGADEAVGMPLAAAVGATLDPDVIVADGGTVETTHRRIDGAEIAVRASAAVMAGGGHVLVCHDETARRRAQERFRTVVATLREAVVVVDADGRIETANPAAQRMFGRTATAHGADLEHLGLLDRQGRPIESADNPLCTALETGRVPKSRLLRHRNSDGGDRWLTVSCGRLEPDRTGSAIVASFADITEQRAASERLRYAATHDALTGLANRAAVVTRLDHVLREPDPARTTIVSYVDLNDFKTLNDSLGHSVGDEVLRVAAQRLRRTAGSGDVVGRIGGDEFVVVTSAPCEDDAASQAARLRQVLAVPIDVYGKVLRIDASVGVVTVAAAGDPRTSTELLRDADIAMYHAKATGRAGYAVFNVELRERMQRRQQLEQGLRGPEAAAQLSTVYQPIVELTTGRTHAVEALLRWTHPTLGSVSPAEFIPLAEESDLIDVLGRFVLTRAADDIADLRRDHPDLHVSVNLSVRQTTDPDLVPLITGVLEASGLPANALYVEITESAVMSDPAAAAAALASLRRLGVRVALDDFGTGYSSLVQLNRLPLDVIKIGKPFVDDLGTSPQADAIVIAMIGVAHSTGRLVVAEGVETPGQLAMLRDYGCDAAQGFLLGCPMPLSALRAGEWLKGPERN
ncbi:MAG TPA: EAL domain-containing protein [Aldersonia sp.]